MRTFIIAMLLASSAGCAKKSPPAAAPKAAEPAPPESTTPGAPTPNDTKQTSDPCDGGEKPAPDK